MFPPHHWNKILNILRNQSCFHMPNLSMKGKGKVRKICYLFIVSLYIVEALLIESLFCYILSICPWRDWCMQMPLEKQETQALKATRRFLRSKWRWKQENDWNGNLKNKEFWNPSKQKRKKIYIILFTFANFVSTFNCSVKSISYFFLMKKWINLWKTAGEWQESKYGTVLERSVDRGVPTERQGKVSCSNRLREHKYTHWIQEMRKEISEPFKWHLEKFTISAAIPENCKAENKSISRE